MNFYEDISKKKPIMKKGTFSNYRYKAGYKVNKKNLDPESNLIEAFWETFNAKRTLHSGQKEIIKAFFEDKAKYIFMRVGRKGAKTTTNIIIAWAYCLEAPNRTCFITLPTIDQARDIYWDEKRIQNCDFQDTELHDKFVKNVETSRVMVTFVNGSFIKLCGTWNEEKGRGSQPNLFIVDEVKDCSAGYLDGAEPNLAAKEDARCVMSGTPPNQKNHYHEWEKRIINNENGYHFRHSSYVNTALPHLKKWLDEKREELIQAGKEDVWLREYMAEDCFSSDERILPDIHVEDSLEMIQKLKKFDVSSFEPILGITITKQKLCACYCVMLPSKTEGCKIWVVKSETIERLWDKSYKSLYEKMTKNMEEISKIFPHYWKKIVYDETKSFVDVIYEFIESRKDMKWQERGIPLLKEMILDEKMFIGTDAGQFGVESQNILKNENILDYPTVCTLSMISNEFFRPPSLSKEEKEEWDKFAPLREAGIVCYPKKKILRKFKF